MAVSDGVTAAMIAQVRRMTDETTTATYGDDLITTYIASYPLIDGRGEQPFSWDTSEEPPVEEDNDDWIPSFCLHSAAGDIWEEKAAALSGNFDFSVDGGNFSVRQKHENCLVQARRHRSRRAAKTINLIRETRALSSAWIGNLAEEDD